ncbi:type IX secretion system membrane protein PorP/SprF [Bacteroides sp.]|uniref:PorP/SprF family type IX secretion system membrane protein n=1 Tax=Bacteroides sp. TaxID=29523 RepID=UPI0026108EEE|nr:type IX secretion system membrane protein PorP/SprF [Bacteroides sp.]MDD3041271.1 type IX secretion system membrane protein PorP/SprF [Bacteroides sp.]
MNKIYLAVLIAVVTLFEAQAQQDPHYTQYMYNMNVMNPAYAGSKENLSLGLLYRKQWVDIEGAPSTFTFSGHTPAGKNVGIGLSVIADQIGPVKEQNVYGDFSYTLQLGGEHKLALGLKAGATFQKIGLFSQISPSLPVPTDPGFSEDTSNIYFNLGTGVFYYTNKYYVALSVPNMIKANYLDYNGVKYGTETQHYFLTGGYVFDLNPNLKFKPFAMLKSAFNSPSSLDVSANFLFNERFEIGGTYRVDDSFGAMVNFAITPSLRIGYAYDNIISEIKTVAPSSHEIILLFDVNFPKKVSRSPRFF